MNLFKIGDTTLNMDRVNGLQDHQPPADPSAPAGATVLRVLFDDGHLDLVGPDAQALRRWVRHIARNLAPHRDEDGAELIAPEDQLKTLSDLLLNLVDHVRPRDAHLRGAARRLADLLDLYMTGQLRPANAAGFARSVESLRAEIHADQDLPLP